MTDRPPRDVTVVVFDGVQPLDAFGPHEVFAGANAVLDARSSRARRYSLQIVSPHAPEPRTESGLRVLADPLDAAPRRIDTVVIAGGAGARDAAVQDAVGAWLVDRAARARRTAFVCTGAFIGAAAGLLDGRRVTTHWAFGDELARVAPAVEVDVDPLYVRDGSVWTSAGVTAGIDLALALVAEDHGTDVAQTVARWLVMFVRRPGGQSQFAAPVWRSAAPDGPIRRAQELVDLDPTEDHRLDVLAARVGLSTRHLGREFRRLTGWTPAEYVELARLDVARRALEHAAAPIEVISRLAGFGTPETMRRTFLRHLGVTPSDYRRRFAVDPGRAA